MGWLNPTIEAAGNILGTLTGGTFGTVNQNKQNKFNAEEAQKNRDFQVAEREATQKFNIDMWNLNNEYNSPANQVKRLQEAGISPSTMLQGSAQPFTPSAVTSNPSMGSQAQAAGGSLASSMMNAGANLGKNTADVINALSQSRATDWQTKFYKRTEEQRVKLLEQEFDKNEALIMDWVSSAGVKNATAEQIRETQKYIGRRNEAEIANLEQLFAVYKNQADLLASEKNYTDEKALTEGANRDLIGSQKNLTDEQGRIAVYDAQLRKLTADLANELGLPVDAPQFMIMLKLAKQNKLDEFIEKTITKPERGKWKPKDWEENTSYENETKIKLGFLGDWGWGSKGHNSRDVRRRPGTKFFDENTKNPTVMQPSNVAPMRSIR